MNYFTAHCSILAGLDDDDESEMSSSGEVVAECTLALWLVSANINTTTRHCTLHWREKYFILVIEN